MNYLDHAYQILKSKLISWMDAAIAMLPNIAVALIVMTFFFLIGRLLKRLLYPIFTRFTGNAPLSRFLSHLLSLMIGLFGLIIVLDIINLDRTITSLLAGAGILGLAFSLAFQNVLANFVSSVIIMTRKPFTIGDMIESNGIFGKVEKVNLRATMVAVPEGQLAIIPNKQIIESVLLNYSHFGKRRVDIKVTVRYEEDPAQIRMMAVQGIEEACPLIEGLPVEAYTEKFDEQGLVMLFRFWISFEAQQDFFKAQSLALEAIHSAFREHNINVPVSVRTLETGTSFNFSLQE